MDDHGGHTVQLWAGKVWMGYGVRRGFKHVRPGASVALP